MELGEQRAEPMNKAKRKDLFAILPVGKEGIQLPAALHHYYERVDT